MTPETKSGSNEETGPDLLKAGQPSSNGPIKLGLETSLTRKKQCRRRSSKQSGTNRPEGEHRERKTGLELDPQLRRAVSH